MKLLSLLSFLCCSAFVVHSLESFDELESALNDFNLDEAFHDPNPQSYKGYDESEHMEGYDAPLRHSHDPDTHFGSPEFTPSPPNLLASSEDDDRSRMPKDEGSDGKFPSEMEKMHHPDTDHEKLEHYLLDEPITDKEENVKVEERKKVLSEPDSQFGEFEGYSVNDKDKPSKNLQASGEDHFDFAEMFKGDVDSLESELITSGGRSSICDDSQWMCSSGTQCIKKKFHCDGKKNCWDGSDEDDCEDDGSAKRCSRLNCIEPKCRCVSSNIPLGLTLKTIPQMVMLSFDDAVRTIDTEKFVDNLYKTLNPNGCPIRSTFFASHEFTDYPTLNALFANGHEIALHSISHRIPENYWSSLSFKDWIKEIIGERALIHKLSKIPKREIVGMRAPFLRIGGDNQMKMLKSFQMLYDSSWTVSQSRQPIFPFTLDYRVNLTCHIKPCPRNSYPGLWEVPLITMTRGRHTCSMVDGCGIPSSQEETYKFLMQNFEKFYNSNKAPFPLFMHPSYFRAAHVLKGLEDFIAEILTRDDVYILPVKSVVEWMKNPVPLDEMDDMRAPFNKYCLPFRKEIAEECTEPKMCSYSIKARNQGGAATTRYLRVCTKCPKTYPWTNNFFRLK